ncbi:bud emergence protein 1 [Tulasnella sp. 419]|nr:bud emergence protein 1 [Tulasnella sp. 419]
MKSLRRSLNKEPPAISTPLSTFPLLSKPVAATEPPKRVIKATHPYRSNGPQELSVQPGDFLYVIKEIDRGDGSAWFEAHNPTTKARGIVPKRCFEELNRTHRITSTHLPPHLSSQPRPVPKHQTFYAIVQYDFNAERPDELDARAGEPISVVAQSNREWFVAKPIGRLGGPGLIPVAFVEIRDPATGQPVVDVDALMDRGDLPRVEEWKQATAEYKASSIPLGVIEDATQNSVPDSPYNQQNQWGTASSHPQQHPSNGPRNPPYVDNSAAPNQPASSEIQPTEEAELPPGTILSATIPSFHFENNEYWFRIDGVYQPSNRTSPQLRLILYRNYDDFYDFQISLLDTFPVEAGRGLPDDHGLPTPPASVEDSSTRILPFMPGPVSYVDDMITSVRQTELDQYLEELCSLGTQHGAHHVLSHSLVRSFFGPKPGDLMEEIEGTGGDPGPSARNSQNVNGEQDPSDAAASMAKLRLEDQGVSHSRGQSMHRSSAAGSDLSSAYGGVRASSGYNDDYGNGNTRFSRNGGSHSTAGYGQGGHGGTSPYANGHSRTDSRPNSSGFNGSSNISGHSYTNSYSANSANLSPPLSHAQAHPTSRPTSDHAPTTSTRSSGHHNSGETAPASDPPFLKIKIFHSESDDLIAIRVPPRVSFNQLISKVRDRLGANVGVLKYRDSMGGERAWREIANEADLKEWLSRGDKLVLYC